MIYNKILVTVISKQWVSGWIFIFHFIAFHHFYMSFLKKLIFAFIFELQKSKDFYTWWKLEPCLRSYLLCGLTWDFLIVTVLQGNSSSLSCPLQWRLLVGTSGHQCKRPEQKARPREHRPSLVQSMWGAQVWVLSCTPCLMLVLPMARRDPEAPK